MRLCASIASQCRGTKNVFVIKLLKLKKATRYSKLSFCHPSQRNEHIKMWETRPNDYWVFSKMAAFLSLIPWSSLSKMAAESNFPPWGRMSNSLLTYASIPVGFPHPLSHPGATIDRCIGTERALTSVILAGKRYSRRHSTTDFIIFCLEEGLTSFNKNNRANFCGEKKKKKRNNKAFWGDDIFWEYSKKLCPLVVIVNEWTGVGTVHRTDSVNYHG